MNSFSVRNVNQIYGEGTAKVHVLHDVNFEAEPGTLSLIMGPSGSGKSTFLTIIGGLLTPTSGHVEVNGVDYAKRSKKERDQMRLDAIGFVLQTYHLLPYLTVADQFKLVDKVKPEGNLSAQALDDVLETLDIKSLMHKFPNELSGGQQQRVAIARALYPDPSIILADEPTGNLDSKMGAEVMELLHKLNKEDGRTIVMVTHNEEQAKQTSRTIRFFDGRQVQ